jgi:hypothetical protein
VEVEMQVVTHQLKVMQVATVKPQTQVQTVRAEAVVLQQRVNLIKATQVEQVVQERLIQ